MRNETEFEEREEMTGTCPCCGQVVYLERIGQDPRDVCPAPVQLNGEGARTYATKCVLRSKDYSERAAAM